MQEMGRFDPRLADERPCIRFGSWVGTDRDGNPNVTAETSLNAAERLRRSILDYYLRRLDRISQRDLFSVLAPRPRAQNARGY